MRLNTPTAVMSPSLPRAVFAAVVAAIAGGVLAPGRLAPFALAQIGGGGPVSELFNTTCASCHGVTGKGGPSGTPSLLNDEFFVPSRDREYFDAIKNGLPNTTMNGFSESLSDSQVWSMVVHIRELQYKHMRETKAPVTPKGAPAGTAFKTQHALFTVETVVGSGLETPWAVESLPEGSALSKLTVAGDEVKAAGAKALPALLITEREGNLRLLVGGRLSKAIEGTPEVFASGQGGLMDVALHPEFALGDAGGDAGGGAGSGAGVGAVGGAVGGAGEGAGSGWVYLSFADPKTVGGRKVTTTKVVRGKITATQTPQGATLRWTDQQTIFESKPELYVRTGLHFGCRIAFDPAGVSGKRGGYVFFGIGEHGRGSDSDDLTKPNGKVHRLHDDGRVPSDNPFVDVKGALSSIWSYGHRNPQGLAFGADGTLWETEHAPRGGDELNVITRAGHYGWPLLSYGINYNDTPYQTPFADVTLAANAGLDAASTERSKPKPSEVTDAAHRWLPSIAACGLTLVGAGPKGEAFPGWRGDLLAGGLAMQTVQRVRVIGGAVTEVEEVFHGRGRVRDVVTAIDGSVLIVLNDPDRVVRLAPVTTP